MEDRKVRVLLENIDHQYKTMSEILSDIPVMKKDISELKEDMKIVKEDVSLIKLTLPNKANVSDLEKVQKDVNIINKRLNLKGV